MMEIVQMEEGEKSEHVLRLDMMCLRAAVRNYSIAEFENSVKVSDTNSTLRSWARDLWQIGSNVLLRSDPNCYSRQILQLLSQYGIGWISIDPSEISAQGSLRRSLSLLESHGLIHLDVRQRRIIIEGINLTKEIQEKFQFNQKCVCDLEMVQEFLGLLNKSSGSISRPRHMGLTSTLRLVLSHPQFKLTPGFEPFFDQWVRGLLDHPSQGLNEGEKWVMSAGIEVHEGIRSYRFRSLQIRSLFRQVFKSNKDGQITGLRSDPENGNGVKDDIDFMMRRAMTYITLLETTVGSITVNQFHHPNPQVQHYIVHLPNNLNQHQLYAILTDYVAVGQLFRKLTLTPDLIGLLEELTHFFMSGWNSWKQLERAHQFPYGYGENFGSVFFAGLLDCLNKQGKREKILTLVKDTKEFLSQLQPGDRFKAFFPERVLAHALSLGQGQESANENEKKSLLLELESYLMGIFRAQVNQRPVYHRYQRGRSDDLLPHLFNCLAQLGRYQTLHGIITDLNSHIQTLTTTTDLSPYHIDPFVHLPPALATSVKDIDFVVKRALLEETFGLGRRLVRMTLDLVTYENTRKVGGDPMEGLIAFCFESGMVHELTGFIQELEVFLMNKYGEDRVGPITTTILYFGERVTDGLKQIMGPVKMTNYDWSEFLEQVKCSVVKWTQLISTPPHVHEKKSWMDGMADLICRKSDSYLEERSKYS